MSQTDDSSKAIKGVTSSVIDLKSKKKHALIICEQQQAQIESPTHDTCAYLTRRLSA